MAVFGIDISHHQDAALDLARCKREGISFVFLKATEGNSFIDREFKANLAEARKAGLLVAAYHYVRGHVSASAQVAHISRVVPKSVPVIPDTEDGGGYLPLTRDLITKLRAAGYRVPLLYLPRWYWQRIGSPDMKGLPPLWASRYPDMVQGSLADEWDDVPASYWTGYGGLPVAVLQFTSSARIAGHAPIDANAFRGTPAQLAALLGGSTTTEDDLTPEQDRKLNELHQMWRKGNQTAGHPQTVGEGTRYIVEILTRSRAQDATIDKLSDLVASAHGLSAADVKASVKEAIAESVIDVDINVGTKEGN